MFFLRFLISSIINEFKARLLPIINGQSVFRLVGGKPCFHKEDRMLVFIVRPLLLDFSERPSFFLESDQQEHIA
jgi:hypothetical protein